MITLTTAEAETLLGYVEESQNRLSPYLGQLTKKEEREYAPVARPSSGYGCVLLTLWPTARGHPRPLARLAAMMEGGEPTEPRPTIYTMEIVE